MNKMKKRHALMLTVGMAATLLFPVKGHAIDLPIYVNGTKATFPSDQQPYVTSNSRTMVSVRGISEVLGYDVVWNGTNQTVEVTYGTNKMILPLDKNVMTLNGQNITNDAKPEVINQRVFIPLRAVAEGMGADVGYDGTTGKITVDAASVSTTTYTVVSGDTLFSVSKKFSLTVDQLKQLNNLTTNSIYAGQKLTVKAVTVAPTPTQPVTSTPTATVNSQYKKTYVVASGDSLSKIAGLFNLSVEELKAKNKLTTNTIYAGQKLVISGEQNTKEYNVSNVVKSAKALIGTPYLWAGTTPSGFDCSGFVQYVFNQNAIKLTRTTFTMWDDSIPVDEPSYGDLVFFETYDKGPTHVGIYLGDNQFIQAGSSGVSITDMTYDYWKTRYLGARSIK